MKNPNPLKIILAVCMIYVTIIRIIVLAPLNLLKNHANDQNKGKKSRK